MSALLCLPVTQAKGLKASIAATAKNADRQKEDSVSFPVAPISLWPFLRSARSFFAFPPSAIWPVLIRSVWRSRLIAWQREVREPWPGKSTLQLNPSLTRKMRSGCFLFLLEASLKGQFSLCPLPVHRTSPDRTSPSVCRVLQNVVF